MNKGKFQEFITFHNHSFINSTIGKKTVEKCSEDLGRWKARDLSLVGRVSVLNVLITSKLNYLFESLGQEESYLKDCKKNLMINFYGCPGVQQGKMYKFSNMIYIGRKIREVQIWYNLRTNNIFRKFTERNFQSLEEKNSFFKDYNLTFIIYYLQRLYRLEWMPIYRM